MDFTPEGIAMNATNAKHEPAMLAGLDHVSQPDAEPFMKSRTCFARNLRQMYRRRPACLWCNAPGNDHHSSYTGLKWRNRVFWLLFLILSYIPSPAFAYNEQIAEAKYIESFLALYPKVHPVPTLEEYATAEHFDKMWLGERLEKELKDYTNDDGALAWWLTYYIRALDDMYLATDDVKYLDASLRIVRAAVGCTDDKRNIPLFTGKIVPSWGSPKYAERGRAVLVVNTGLICAALFDFLLTAKKAPAFDGALGAEHKVILDTAFRAMEVHERQWREGPEAQAGHYIGMDQENMYEHKILPANRQSSMGWAYWLAYKYTGGAAYRERALAIGRFIRDRLVPSPDGAFYWTYESPEKPVSGEKHRDEILGEDTSHAGLTMMLPFALAAGNEIFFKSDMERLAGMVMHGLARLGGGVFLGDITGNAYSKPERIRFISNWLPLSKYNPEVRKEVVSFYLNHRPNPDPIELAQLILMLKKNVY